MIFYYYYKYLDGMDPDHKRSIRIRKAHLNNHDDFMRCIIKNMAHPNDEFLKEIPVSCIKRLLPKHDWEKSHISVLLPENYNGNYFEYVRNALKNGTYQNE